MGEALEIKLAQVSAEMSLPQMLRFMEKFNGIVQDVKSSFIAQLPLELAIIELTLADSAGKVAAAISSALPPQIEVSTPKPAVRPANSNIDRDGIVAGWQEVLVKIKPFNHSLSFVLQSCEISSLEGNRLNLTFKHKFHRDRINMPQIKTVLEKILSEVYGSPLSVEALLDENLVLSSVAPEVTEEKTETTPSVIDDILKAFGGEVIK